jgi:D-sedoheptulose 7-phosphate isomerase
MVAMLTADRAAEAFARRRAPANALTADADAIALACHAMAGRFDRGGRLVVFGEGGSVSDAAHVVVEFVHPVIVGKRALPAFALPGPDFAGQLRLLAEPVDIALGVSAGADPDVLDGLRVAGRAGLLTIGMFGAAAGAAGPAGEDWPEHRFVVRSDDPLVVKEVQVTTYHVLWELVHVFLERGGQQR